MVSTDLSLDLFEDHHVVDGLAAAVTAMASDGATERGAVFTRPQIVDAILDLSGYTSDRALHTMRLLEPACGAGGFLRRVVERLWCAYLADGGSVQRAAHDLCDVVRAVELHPATFEKARERLGTQLAAFGVSSAHANSLCDAWLVQGDFLLTPLSGLFDFVVGNPPYVRQERIPAALLSVYRQRYQTLYDRADLYVPFYERGLNLLAEGGVLGFICANRWLKNRYGGPLRDKISRDFWLKYFLDMEQTDAFDSDVIAYPAVTILQRSGETSVSVQTTRVSVTGDAPLVEMVGALLADEPKPGLVQEFDLHGSGAAPLLLDDMPRIALVRDIEARFPSIEQSGCKVGIGVATGCDRVYIAGIDQLPVEPDRKLPLVMSRDLVDGKINWGGKAVLNPFDDTGQLVDLAQFPRFERYLRTHEELIAKRNVAKRNPQGWYRTIDRIRPGLLQASKILVPDIKGTGTFVVDNGQYYPHHNLYYILSNEWDLRALQAVLRSSLTLMTIAMYCTRMSGGFLRFQAQYLRRIRLPQWCSVEPAMRDRLKEISDTGEQATIDAVVSDLYCLTASQAAGIRQAADAARAVRSRKA